MAARTNATSDISDSAPQHLLSDVGPAHTPGPWHVTTNRHPTTGGKSWGAVEAVRHPHGGAGSYPAGTTLTWEGRAGYANARLIAAAPETKAQRDELLAACSACVKALARFSGAAGSDDFQPAWEALGEAGADAVMVIARATETTPL